MEAAQPPRRGLDDRRHVVIALGAEFAGRGRDGEQGPMTELAVLSSAPHLVGSPGEGISVSPLNEHSASAGLFRQMGAGIELGETTWSSSAERA